METTVTKITDINWEKRRFDAAISFGLDGDGLPINPFQPDLPEGPGGLRWWGEQQAADAIVTAELEGELHLLLIQRGDDGTWALPGGMLDDPDEDPLEGALRELLEETGLKVDTDAVSLEVLQVRYVPDPRASRQAWVVTWPSVIALGEVAELPKVVGADDARRAEWVRAGSYEQLVAEVAGLGGRVFSAHVSMLGEVLG